MLDASKDPGAHAVQTFPRVRKYPELQAQAVLPLMAIPFELHAVHAADPLTEEKVLPVHGVHTANGAEDVVPAGQAVQTEELVAAPWVE